ncbi:MAG: M23 family metallopeptidase [Candidatus Eisenbacteria bacterium]|nr:M23 family metallopeptidase [Candidatus Eisenbacteria bacterium]
MSSAPPLLGGLLPLAPELDARWSEAGAWQMPVGARYELGSNGVSPPFKENRGTELGRRKVTHQGTDLANGQFGDTIRAAGSGVVIVAFDGDKGNGYGGHVVIAHRIPVDRVVYTVYGHIGRGTIVVEPGDLVVAGDPIGRVGQTGRASTPHLHFEVREGDDPFARWENAHVIEPLPFLFSRLAGQREEPGPDRAYAEWAGIRRAHRRPSRSDRAAHPRGLVAHARARRGRRPEPDAAGRAPARLAHRRGRAARGRGGRGVAGPARLGGMRARREAPARARRAHGARPAGRTRAQGRVRIALRSRLPHRAHRRAAPPLERPDDRGRLRAARRPLRPRAGGGAEARGPRAGEEREGVQGREGQAFLALACRAAQARLGEEAQAPLRPHARRRVPPRLTLARARWHCPARIEGCDGDSTPAHGTSEPGTV